MLDNESDQTPESTTTDIANEPPQVAPPAKKTTKKAAAKKAAKKTTKKAAAKKAAKKAAPEPTDAGTEPTGTAPEASPEPAELPLGAPDGDVGDQPAVKKAAARKTAKKTTRKTTAKKASERVEAAPEQSTEASTTTAGQEAGPAEGADQPGATSPLFQPPDPVKAVPRKRTRKKAAAAPETAEPTAESAEPTPEQPADKQAEPKPDGDREADSDRAATGAEDEGEEAGGRRRRRRGGRRRRKSGQGDNQAEESADQSKDRAAEPAEAKGDEKQDADSGEEAGGSRRRRRRRRSGESGAGTSADDPENTVVRVREPRKSSDDEISGFTGSTRLEAKKQRRREGREAGRRRAPIVSEAEFLARRESVDRTMVVRQHDDLTQIAVLEDKMLVEHYVARESQTSLIGNVYLGRVQNVLPSMEAAFVDIGKGRNAVLYAGEVNWDVLGKEGQPRRIETALKPGQTVLVQVTKDPVGHKGARLTSQVSLPGRYLVYVPGGQTSGISRKLPDTERNRLKNLLKEIIPEEAGVIIRTAAEGASEDELRRDVTRLTARWEDIEKKVEAGHAPSLLYGEPDLMIKVIRDLFTEDFGKLVVSGDDAWDTIEGYVGHVAPDLMDRVQRWDGDKEGDVFASYRVDEQIAKGLDRKVFLPSGGSLVIDRTEAMTVVDVNTGKFTGSGGNLEETVTKNNLEAAEEIVRQLRLRDIGGIIVIDFIDMVLESNRDLVLRRLIECLGRDRTKHQVAEVTSLGLVQMTRKRIGTGLLEAFSETCEHCNGRGLIVHHEPVEPKKPKRDEEEQRRGKRGRRRGGGEGEKAAAKQGEKPAAKKAEKPAEKQPEKPAEEKQPEKPGAEKPAEQPEPRQEPTAPESPPEPATPEPTAPAATPDGQAGKAPATAPAGEAAAPEPAPAPRRTRRRAATRPAGPPQ